MAKAYTCDRCGEFFKQSDYVPGIPVVLESDREFHIDFGNTREFLSLCPDCRKSFQKWWDVGIVSCMKHADKTEYNNGVCQKCGGHLEYEQAVGHQYITSYIYKCDKCGDRIELYYSPD